MLSNPVTLYVDGQNTESFTYEGGKALYHFSPYDNGLSSTLECNVIFFANDERHAADVLSRMFKHVIDCYEKYIKNETASDIHGFISSAEIHAAQYQTWLKVLEDGKIKLTLAPTNQFYKVGWALNDTI